MNAGDYELALRYLTEATKYRLIDPVRWYDLGIAQEHFGRNKEALESFKHALSLDPQSEDYQRAVKSLSWRVSSAGQ